MVLHHWQVLLRLLLWFNRYYYDCYYYDVHGVWLGQSVSQLLQPPVTEYTVVSYSNRRALPPGGRLRSPPGPSAGDGNSDDDNSDNNNNNENNTRNNSNDSTANIYTYSRRTQVWSLGLERKKQSFIPLESCQVCFSHGIWRIGFLRSV